MHAINVSRHLKSGIVPPPTQQSRNPAPPQSPDALVVGHICLDIIPELPSHVAFEPGRLVEAGPARLSTGGAVSNTGLSLLKLGVNTRLLGKVGPGIFGRAVLEILERNAPGSSASMISAPEETTSYTIVVSLTGKDRMFLHSPGANATFCSADVSDEELANTRLMHLGYPPLLARMFADDGRELIDLFKRAKDAGATTSLDLSLPDCEAPSGRADWPKILQSVIPHVDFFLPSVEELLFMLERRTFDSLRGAIYGELPDKLMQRLNRQALDLGAKCVGLKVGSRGFILSVGSDLSNMGRAKPEWESWLGQSFWHPCFEVEVAGTTGAGDATIAGFLMAVLHGLDPFQATEAAVAVGACCCEQPDAVSGVRSWPETKQRIESGWPVMPLAHLDGWSQKGAVQYRAREPLAP